MPTVHIIMTLITQQSSTPTQPPSPPLTLTPTTPQPPPHLTPQPPPEDVLACGTL